MRGTRSTVRAAQPAGSASPASASRLESLRSTFSVLAQPREREAGPRALFIGAQRPAGAGLQLTPQDPGKEGGKVRGPQRSSSRLAFHGSKGGAHGVWLPVSAATQPPGACEQDTAHSPARAPASASAGGGADALLAPPRRPEPSERSAALPAELWRSMGGGGPALRSARHLDPPESRPRLAQSPLHRALGPGGLWEAWGRCLPLPQGRPGEPPGSTFPPTPRTHPRPGQEKSKRE